MAATSLLTKKEDKVVPETSNQRRIAEEEEEIAQLLTPEEEGSEEELDPSEWEEPTSAEERIFKKRYGDLRRHSQKKEEELSAELEDLKAQVEASSLESGLPEEREKVMEWAREHPDFARIVQTLSKDVAESQFKQKSDDLEARIADMEEMSMEVSIKELESNIRVSHPDYDTLKESDEFYEWAEKQPSWIQDALFANSSDAPSVIRVIDLYKSDMGRSVVGEEEKSVRPNAKDAAMAVTQKSPTSIDPQGNKDMIYESQVSKMTDRQYAKDADKIQEAISTGKFVYDLSGKE